MEVLTFLVITTSTVLVIASTFHDFTSTLKFKTFVKLN